MISLPSKCSKLERTSLREAGVGEGIAGAVVVKAVGLRRKILVW
jgi:hypothetical protein